jgi:hypothetical protein
MIRILIVAPAPLVRARTLLRIGLSAVVDDSVIVEGSIVTTETPARKPCLLILRQVAYPDRGWPGAIVTDDEFSTR